MLFWHSKSYFDIQTETENRILTFEILFWHSKWVGKCHYFDIQNPILTFELSRKILFFHSKILFWHSNWVGKCYFDIRNPILTFELSPKILFRHSKSYFYILTESGNAILTFQILFWLSNWVGKFCFDIRNPILTFELSRKNVFSHWNSYFDMRNESENYILTFEILFWHSNWVGK